MKKDIKWLKEEIWKQDIVMDKGYIYTDDLMSIINEVDEPEVKQLDKKIRELESYNDELIRDNNQLRNALDNQEVLSQEWIDENKVARINNVRKMTTSDVVTVEKLKNLLVPKQNKPVIPKFVADYIEQSKKDNDSINQVFAFIDDKEDKDLWHWLFPSMYEKKRVNQEVFMRAWLDGYEVEKEKKYRVVFRSHKDDLILFKTGEHIFIGAESANGGNWKQHFTESEIKAIDKRYWSFADEVKE